MIATFPPAKLALFASMSPAKLARERRSVEKALREAESHGGSLNAKVAEAHRETLAVIAQVQSVA